MGFFTKLIIWFLIVAGASYFYREVLYFDKYGDLAEYYIIAIIAGCLLVIATILASFHTWVVVTIEKIDKRQFRERKDKETDS